ncbi:MAG: beta-galactosidase [Candidatus Omnitrophica bacterium]|nr:beta-galactosidase [Candidatus Omnitrophota bacterium]
MKIWIICLSLFLNFNSLIWPDNMSRDRRDSESPYGVLDFFAWSEGLNNDFYDHEKISTAIKLMKEAGVAFVRIDLLWADIEPEENRFVFTKYDYIVDELWNNGIKILAILGYNRSRQEDRWRCAPEPEMFSRYAGATVGHYKDKIKYWEIWNEPDSEFYWQPQDGLKHYSELLKKTYRAIKSVDPTAKVLMGGLSKDFEKNLRALYNYGCKDYFDIVNIHPFVNPLLPRALEVLYALYHETHYVIQHHGDIHKEIWFTEIGCPGHNEPTEWWLGEGPSEVTQARWVETVYREPLKWPGVKKIFWAFFRDTPAHWGNGIDYFGLVHTDFSKKPAFEAYKKAAVAREGI